jgi:sugar lactone lactonase YvrE
MPLLSALDPIKAIEGGRLVVHGEGFPPPSSPADDVTIGGVGARIAFAAPDRVAVAVPSGLEGGSLPVKVAWVPGATLFSDVGTALARGLHQVDNPVVAGDGTIYVTYSGSRGQEAAVSIFRVTTDGAREPFVTGLVNATSMAIGPDGHLYVSSRFEGRVYRVYEDGRYEVVASDLGVTCGLAFAPDGVLLVGDRTGTIFRVDLKGKTETFANVPASVAAFHLAMGPDDSLYVSAPTLSTYDYLRRVDANGRIDVIDVPFGRPQGIAFDANGVLHVAEALAGSSGIYALRPAASPDLVVAGPGLVGLAFKPDGGIVAASQDTVYGFEMRAPEGLPDHRT